MEVKRLGALIVLLLIALAAAAAAAVGVFPAQCVVSHGAPATRAYCIYPGVMGLVRIDQRDAPRVSSGAMRAIQVRMGDGARLTHFSVIAVHDAMPGCVYTVARDTGAIVRYTLDESDPTHTVMRTPVAIVGATTSLRTLSLAFSADGLRVALAVGGTSPMVQRYSRLLGSETSETWLPTGAYSIHGDVGMHAQASVMSVPDPFVPRGFPMQYIDVFGVWMNDIDDVSGALVQYVETHFTDKYSAHYPRDGGYVHAVSVPYYDASMWGLSWATATPNPPTQCDGGGSSLTASSTFSGRDLYYSDLETTAFYSALVQLNRTLQCVHPRTQSATSTSVPVDATTSRLHCMRTNRIAEEWVSQLYTSPPPAPAMPDSLTLDATTRDCDNTTSASALWRAALKGGAFVVDAAAVPTFTRAGFAAMHADACARGSACTEMLAAYNVWIVHTYAALSSANRKVVSAGVMATLPWNHAAAMDESAQAMLVAFDQAVASAIEESLFTTPPPTTTTTTPPPTTTTTTTAAPTTTTTTTTTTRPTTTTAAPDASDAASMTTPAPIYIAPDVMPTTTPELTEDFELVTHAPAVPIGPKAPAQEEASAWRFVAIVMYVLLGASVVVFGGLLCVAFVRKHHVYGVLRLVKHTREKARTMRRRNRYDALEPLAVDDMTGWVIMPHRGDVAVNVYVPRHGPIPGSTPPSMSSIATWTPDPHFEASPEFRDATHTLTLLRDADGGRMDLE